MIPSNPPLGWVPTLDAITANTFIAPDGYVYLSLKFQSGSLTIETETPLTPALADWVAAALTSSVADARRLFPDWPEVEVIEGSVIMPRQPCRAAKVTVTHDEPEDLSNDNR